MNGFAGELNGVNYLSADGDGGQYINIFPEQNMVIVMTQGNYSEWPLYVNQANDMMGNFILPAVKPQLWSEEFNAGSALDTNVWSYDLGQTGCDRPDTGPAADWRPRPAHWNRLIACAS